jgi:hypothetical protein
LIARHTRTEGYRLQDADDDQQTLLKDKSYEVIRFVCQNSFKSFAKLFAKSAEAP